jgi:dihydroorotase-like cyclic amidohydrolase
VGRWDRHGILLGGSFTPTDTYAGDIGITSGQIATIGRSTSTYCPDNWLKPKGCMVIPAGSTYRIWTRRSGHHQRRRFLNRHAHPCFFGSTTTLIDFAIQCKRPMLRLHLRYLDEKSERKGRADYAFPCIITELGDA